MLDGNHGAGAAMTGLVALGRTSCRTHNLKPSLSQANVGDFLWSNSRNYRLRTAAKPNTKQVAPTRGAKAVLPAI